MDADAPAPPPADDFEPASAYLEAALVPRRGSPLTKAARTALTIAAGLLTNDLESGPSAIDLVVRRLSNGREVIRMVAGTSAEADRLLQTARRDLDAKRVGDFLAEWTPQASGPHPDPRSPAPPDP